MNSFNLTTTATSSVSLVLSRPDEILERLRAKKEEELEEVKRRAAEEAQKARLEKEKKEADAEKDGAELKLKEEGQLEGDVKGVTKEEGETNEEVTEEKKDGVKTGGNHDASISQNAMTKYVTYRTDEKQHI